MIARHIRTRLPQTRLRGFAVTAVVETKSAVLRSPGARLAPEVLRGMLRNLLQQGKDSSFTIGSVDDLKGVLYNIKAANDRALTVEVIGRFVEPQVVDASVDPAVFTLAIQALEGVGELSSAERLFDVLTSKKASNLHHLCALLNAQRQTNLREANKIPNGNRARIARGLELYKAGLQSLPGSSGSVILATSVLALLNTANSKLLASQSSWLQDGRNIVAQLNDRNITHPLLSGHLMTLEAKGSSTAAEVVGGKPEGKISEFRQKAAELEQKHGPSSYNLYSLTLAALESGDPQSCIELYEEIAPTVSPHAGALSNYIKACAATGGANVLKGINVLLSLPNVRQPQSSFPLQLSLLYKVSLDEKKVKASPELKRAQFSALKLLEELVLKALPLPHLVDALPLRAVSGPVAVHFAVTGRLDQLLQCYPRQRDYEDSDRDPAGGGGVSVGGRPTRVFRFWNDLALGLRRKGQWRSLLALNARVQMMQTVSVRDRLVVLGHCVYAAAAVGRGEEVVRLLHQCNVHRIVKQCEEASALLLLRPLREDAVDEASMLCRVFQFLAVEAGVSSPQTLALALKQVGSFRKQVEAIRGVLDELGEEQRSKLVNSR